MTHFEREIHQQPEVIEKIVGDERIRECASNLKERAFTFILSLARGSSDNAVTFFSYLAARYLGLAVASVPPSLLTLYGARFKLESSLAIGVSQSGESSDVVESLRALKEAGALTLALSNQADSSLAKLADFTLAQHAGVEKAVAASKTFSSQMMVLACLVAHWAEDASLLESLRQVPELMRAQLEDSAAIKAAALRLTHADGLFVLGRGLSYAPSQELALKLKEASYVQAQAYSSAEFQHGPIAAVEESHPVVLLALKDETLASNLAVAERLQAMGADLTVLSSEAGLLDLADTPLPLPQGLHPVSEVFLQVLCGQLFALYITLSKGFDPDAPRHLSKVTKTM